MNHDKLKLTGLFLSFVFFLSSIFAINPTTLQAQSPGDSGTCCPDTGICVIDGEVVGRTHYYKSDGKCGEAGSS